uniref:Merozoite surface protein 1 n=1 Tax=Plasmodium chabaudi chabaudi TaxID=31271 RepID=B9A1D2_PLACU|nr:merozoite surface protein 1 [Plasmodium chabaudi chabaudi]
MKAIGLLFSFVFFAIYCKSETIGVYNDLVHKLEKLEELSVEGLELFQKSQVIVNAQSPETPVDPFADNTFAQKLQPFILKFEELGFTEQTELVNLIKTLGPNKYGLKYLIESKEEFNELMHAINFYYDVLRDKLNDMCANNYCEIPEHLKINVEEIEMLKKVVLGYRKPIENIQDDLVKLEEYIARNKATAETLNTLITEETKKITPEEEAECNDTNCNETKYGKKKAIYQAMYNVIFYKKQLAEIKKVIEVLEKRVATLKKNEAIKPLLQQIEAIRGPAAVTERQITAAGNSEETKQNSTEQTATTVQSGAGVTSTETAGTEQTANKTTGTETTNAVETATGTTPVTDTVTEAVQVPAVPVLTEEEKAKKIAELYAQIKEIAKTIKFNLDGIFVDPVELEYYKKEKKNESCHSTSSCHKNKTPETVIPLNVRYPNGISYPLPEEVVYSKIAHNAAETTYGDLTNVDNTAITEDLTTNEQARKNLIKAIKKKIEAEEQKLVELKADYDTKLAAFNQEKTPFKEAAKKFYESKFRNKLTTEIFEAFKTKRTEYMNKKAALVGCEYGNTQQLINKLNKQLNYLQDYGLRKEIVNTEIEYFSNKKSELQYNINRLANAVQAKQNILVASKHIPLSTLVELQIQKSLLTKLIEQLNKTEFSLNKAHLKDKIYVPQTYGKEGKPEPYYLIAIKKEIDRLAKFIPKIDDMIEKEKQKMEQEPVATGESEQVTTSSGTVTSTQTSAQTAPTPPAAPAPAKEGAETTEKAKEDTTETKEPTATEETSETPAAAPEATPVTEEAQPAAPAEVPAPTTPAAPAAPAAPAKPVMTKLYYLEKLKKFLAFSYACHKYVLLQNSTINKDALSKYALTPEEDKIRTLKRCSELDVLLAIQNNMPTMYSLYENVVDGLQNIYTELYEKEMMYHIYNLKDKNPAVKALLVKAGVIEPEPEPVPPTPAVPAPETAPVQEAAQETTQETTPGTTTPETATPGTTTPETTTPEAPAEPNASETVTQEGTTPAEAPAAQKAQEGASAPSAETVPAAPAPAQPVTSQPASTQVSGQSTNGEGNTRVSAESEDEMFVDDFEVDNFYKSYLQQVDGNNTQFIDFIKSKKELINALTPEKVNQLYLDIAHLKELSEHYYNRYYKYKLKLERLYQKHEQIEAANQKVKEISVLKSRLLKRKKYINGTFYVLSGFANFFNKRREAEKQYVDNAIKNTDMLLKYYKARSKYFTSEAVPLKTLTKTSIDREANYLKIEKFRAYSRLELRLKKNINLGKERITYVSGGLHHVFEEFKELLKNKGYTGKTNPENAPEVIKAFEQYKELLPKGATTPAPVVAPVVAPVPTTTTQATEPEAPTPVPAAAPASGSAATTEGGSNTAVIGSSDNDDDDDDDDDMDQIANAQSTDTEVKDILDAFKSENEYIYTKSLGNTYKSFKKHMLKEFSMIKEDIMTGLNYKLEKRNDFLDVLSYELALFKDINTNKFVVKNPYQLLDNDKKDKQMINLKYAIKGVTEDIETATDGIEFFNKMIELYKPQLNAVNEQIDAIEKDTTDKEEKKKYVPVFEDLKVLYETILNGAKEFSELLQHKLENYKIEKAGFDILMANLETYIRIDEKLEDFVESAEKNKHIASIALNNLNKSGLVTEGESKKILAKMLNMDAMDLLGIGSNHVCISTNIPDNAGCFRYDNGTEEWRCLLGFKKSDDNARCEKDDAPVCNNSNNGGCDPNAECREVENTDTTNSKKIVCTCKEPNPNAYYAGVFCSSSGFMGLSILLIITLIVFNLF